MIDERNSTIGQRIKTARTYRGMTAEKLGDFVGKNKITIYRYETGGIKNISYGMLLKIALCLHTTVDYLVGKTDVIEDTSNDSDNDCVYKRIINQGPQEEKISSLDYKKNRKSNL